MSALTDQIEALIIKGGLHSGARLPPERSLAVALGVSRSRLREAIQHLTSRGILTSRQGGGTYVAAPAASLVLKNALSPLSALAPHEPGYWQDVMEIRKSLEGDIAYYAALRASEEDKACLTQALDHMASSAGLDPQAQAQADADFHMALAQAAQNAVLYQVMAGLRDLLQLSIAESVGKLYRLPSTLDTLEQQHGAIVAAILAGRAEDARLAARQHLEFVEAGLQQLEDAAARQRRSSLALSRTPLHKGS